MNYHKIYDNIIQPLSILIVSVLLSMVGRRVVIEKGFDTGTANLTGIIIFGVCIIIYLTILLIVGHTIVPWIMKILPKKKYTPATILVENGGNEKEETPKQSIEGIRQDAEKRYLEKQNAKISLFLEYSHLVMALFVTDDELLRLDEYIQCYAREESLPDNIIPIKPKKLINLDMCHFGWNMSNYFGFPKQEVAPWLMQFFWDLQDAKPSDITKKLHDSTKTEYNIPIIEDIPKYLREQKS